MKLYYFTHSFPYGLGERWKTNELDVLASMFEKITVVPFCPAGNIGRPKSLPKGVTSLVPLFDDSQPPLRKTDLLRLFASPHRRVFLREFLDRKVYRRKDWLVAWAAASRTASELLDHPAIRRIVGAADKDTVFYFYWGRGSCEMMSLLDSSRLHKSFVRMHRYDLFEFANNNYIPYRRNLLSAVSVAAPSSLAGKAHLDSLYPEFRSKVKVVRCGTIGNGRRVRPSQDGSLRIVSCSLLSPVKRVHLMIEALSLLRVPVIWHHLGDGALRRDLESLVKKHGLGDLFIFHGMVDSERVLDFYAENTLDVFVNTSSSEGVPFSLMEAMSVALPVIATDVGGTGELVDQTVGRLLPASATPERIAETLVEFHRLPSEERGAMAEAAFLRYESDWNAKHLGRELGEFLLSK